SLVARKNVVTGWETHLKQSLSQSRFGSVGPGQYPADPFGLGRPADLERVNFSVNVKERGGGVQIKLVSNLMGPIRPRLKGFRPMNHDGIDSRLNHAGRNPALHYMPLMSQSVLQKAASVHNHR